MRLQVGIRTELRNRAVCGDEQRGVNSIGMTSCCARVKNDMYLGDLTRQKRRAGWDSERIAQLEDLQMVLSSDAADMEPAVRLAEQLNAQRSDSGTSAAPISVAVLPEGPSDSEPGPADASGIIRLRSDRHTRNQLLFLQQNTQTS